MSRYYLSYLKNIFVREPSFILRYYIHRKRVDSDLDYVYMADGKMVHGGLFDRLKGAISIYALSKVHHRQFGILFNTPFYLEKYLEPNQYDWLPDGEQIVYSYPSSRPLIAYSEYIKPKRLLRERKGQIHYYYGENILDYINEAYGCNFEWASLFNELFKPTPYLKNHLKLIKQAVGSNYIALHLRFLNLLGDKVEKSNYPKLEDDEKRQLIENCINKIETIRKLNFDERVKVLVCSDSTLFVEKLRHVLPEIMVVEGKAKHIDSGIFSDDDNLKLFSDIYMIAGANKVYSIIGKGLYPSAFPEYSAKIGNKSFERIAL